MASKELELKVILTAYDRMTRVVREATAKSAAALKTFQDKQAVVQQRSSALAQGSAAVGLGAAAMMVAPIKAYADLEQASTRLQSTMLKDGNILSKNFEEINKLAVELGNTLPGNTADFQQMFVTLLRQGTTEKSILDGVGKSAAYLATALEMPYMEAAKLASKLKEATGVADKDFQAFMDTIARTNQLGVDTGEMQYAFARSAGALKAIKVQGLEASKSMSVLYAMLIKTGASGETIGTGMSAIIRGLYDQKRMAAFNEEAAKLGKSFAFMDKRGNFLGVENFMAQMEKMKGLDTDKQMALINALTGGGADAGFIQILASQGTSGYNDMVKRMAEQATLNDKVTKLLGTLTSKWEAFTGTLENTMAAFGEPLKEDLKAIVEGLTSVAVAIGDFLKTHPTIARTIGWIVLATAAIGALVFTGSMIALWISKVRVAFAVLKFVFGGWINILPAIRTAMMRLPAVFSTVTTAVRTLSAALIANPFIALAVGLVAAITIIYLYWDDFMGWWKKQGELMKLVVRFLMQPFLILVAVIRGVIVAIQKGWREGLTEFINVIKEFSIVASFVTMFEKLWVYLQSVYADLKEAGGKMMTMIADGIKSKLNEAVDAMKNAVKSMREYLPFSPAKKGPFKDLHKIKIVETIAQSIKPAPLSKAMAAMTLAATVAATSPVAAKSASPISSPSRGGSGQVVVNFSPNISVGAGASISKAEIQAILKDQMPELMKAIEQAQERKSRRSFS